MRLINFFFPKSGQTAATLLLHFIHTALFFISKCISFIHNISRIWAICKQNILSIIKICIHERSYYATTLLIQGGVYHMVRLRVAELLEERNLTKYWLWKRLGMSYDNYNKMIKNETHSIRYDIIDSMMKILDCPLEDLFEIIEEDEKNKTGTNFDLNN